MTTTGKGRTARDPKEKALYALGVTERKLERIQGKIDALKAQIAALYDEREAVGVEAAYLAKRWLLAGPFAADTGAVALP